MGPGVPQVDEHGRPLRAAIVWMDERARDDLPLLDRLYGRERIHAVTQGSDGSMPADLPSPGGQGNGIPPELLSLGAQWTDANGAIFDAANGYAGCVPGIHEVLRRRGLLSWPL